VYVLVSGLPGSGKSTLAPPLARALDLPLLAKDVIKEALWDALGPGDRPWSKQLGTAAAVALESLAWSTGGAVIDHFVHVEVVEKWAGFPGVVEVRCACAPEIARARYAARDRHPCHFDAEQVADTYDFWIAEDAARPAVGPRLDVNTAAPADVATIARWVRAQAAR
jgi:adenylate kinase family enzyme